MLKPFSFLRYVRLNATFWLGVAYFINFLITRKLTNDPVTIEGNLPHLIPAVLGMILGIGSTSEKNRARAKLGNILFATFLFTCIFFSLIFSSLDPDSKNWPLPTFLFSMTLGIFGLIILAIDKWGKSSYEFWMKKKTDNYSLEGLLKHMGYSNNIVMSDQEGKLRLLPTLSGLNETVRKSQSNIYLPLLFAEKICPLTEILTMKDVEILYFVPKSEIAGFFFYSVCFINGKFLIDTKILTVNGNDERKTLSVFEIYQKMRKLEKKKISHRIIERVLAI